jgi:hypothetical protein
MTASPARGALPIEAMGRLVGAYAHVEQRLFQILGGFAADPAWPGAALFFSARSAEHGWHAGLFAALVPRLPGFDTDALASGGPRADEALDALAAAADPDRRLEALVGRLYPALLAGYRDHLERAAPVADAPVMRALRLAVADTEGGVSAGRALLARRGRAVSAEPASDALVPWPAEPGP